MEGALDLLSWLTLVAGSFVIVTSAMGLWRLPDFYSRIHAASVTDTLGAGLILLGLAFQTGLSPASLKLFFVLTFLVLTSPTASHALARTAHAHGLRLPEEKGTAPGMASPDTAHEHEEERRL